MDLRHCCCRWRIGRAARATRRTSRAWWPPAGSTSLLVAGGPAPLLFTGDTLFAGGTGRCDLPGGSRSLADASLRALLDTLPSDAVVLPGHGGVTPVGEERGVGDPTLAA